MLEFYSALLTVEATLFGILIAAILVYVQLATTQYSHRIVRLLLLDKRFWTFVLLSMVSSGVAGVGLFASAVPKHDLIPWYDLQTENLVQGQCYAAASFGLLLVSASLFLWLLYHYSRYLQTFTIVKEFARHIRFQDIVDYGYHRYGLAEPSIRDFGGPQALFQEGGGGAEEDEEDNDGTSSQLTSLRNSNC